MKRAAFAGPALAALGASGAAAAQDDGYTALFGRCVGSLIETVTAARADGLANEYMAGHTGELMLLNLWETKTNKTSPFEEGQNVRYVNSKWDIESSVNTVIKVCYETIEMSYTVQALLAQSESESVSGITSNGEGK